MRVHEAVKHLLDAVRNQMDRREYKLFSIE